jgi:hypothetical protein
MYGKTEAGVGLPVLVDSSGKLINVPGGGALADAALHGRLFCAANQAKVATTISLATGWTGLALCNPTGSGKLIIVHEFSYGLTIASDAAGVLSLATTTDSGIASQISARCCRNSYATSIAYVDNAATVVAPVIERPIAQYGTLATSGIAQTGMLVVDLKGSIVLAPGRTVLTDTTTATTATFIFGFMWEEVDA